jgi:hypothetical protein
MSEQVASSAVASFMRTLCGLRRADAGTRSIGTLSSMEIAGFVVAVLAVLIAAASLVYAKGANDRADVANRTAREALDLQARVDAREREYRDVSWRSSFDHGRGFTLTNDGLTDAHRVTLILYGDQDRELHRLGDIRAGQSATVQSRLASVWMREYERSMPLAPPFMTHWSSPLGVASQYSARAVTLYSLPDDVED